MNGVQSKEHSTQNSTALVDDKLLLVQAAEGDRLAFDRLVMMYRNQILNLCVRMLGNYADGEDAAQDVFVNAYSHMKNFRGDSQVSTWLYRIAINTCKNRYSSWWGRLQKKVLRIGHPVHDSDSDDNLVELADMGMGADEVLERKRVNMKISSAIVSLPNNFKELIILRDIQEKSYEEISGIVGLPSGTVKSRLARARDALQKKLKEVCCE
ncbi:MAG: sigma-70 family RNA polymerase sigma factor [Fibrobacter sp.]|nr:sigma-70 family RNA polymerase sigma factor [Fibrobacter sp.]